jgi:hypothetical protein
MTTTRPEITVRHPLLDEQETKLTGEGLGLMKMSPSVRAMLLLLRVYLVLMAGMLLYHMVQPMLGKGH